MGEVTILPTITITHFRTIEPSGNDLLTTEEAAKYLSVAPETVRRLCRRKAITFITVTPKDYRFSRADLDEYITSRRNVRRSAF